MSNSKDKRFYRELKKSIKQEGNKRRRAFFKKNLLESPENAHLCNEYDFGEFNSKQFNGMDQDSTREKKNSH